jgi:hypothetical protein
VAAKKTPAEARFWSKVHKTESCWLWTGSVNEHGYGKFFDGNGRLVGAHRFSWQLANGPIPDDLYVCHDCPGGDNRRCVNPTHLFLGDHSANVADAVKKRVYWTGPRPECARHGESNHNAKLTEEQVLAIRQMRADGVQLKVIAARFGVSHKLVCSITLRRKWKHI